MHIHARFAFFILRLGGIHLISTCMYIISLIIPFLSLFHTCMFHVLVVLFPFADTYEHVIAVLVVVELVSFSLGHYWLT